MKKIITILLVCALMPNLYIPSAFAQEETASYESESFELLNALDIDRGINADGSALITRAEYVAMAVRAINMDKVTSYDGSFTDVSPSHPFVNEIYTAKNLKLTNGTDEGVFSPDASVSVDVALKMTLVAMGYETIAITYGGYPVGYNRLEAKLGITRGISSADALTVDDAKLIITNALKEDVAVFSAIEDDNMVYSTKENVNLLTERFNLKKVSGIVTKAEYLSLNSRFENDSYVTIAGKSYYSLVPSAQYFGLNTDAWIGVDDNKIYALEESGVSRAVIIDAHDIESYSNNKLTVYEGSKTVTYKTNKGISFIENGILISHDDTDFVFPNGTLKLIDSDGNGLYDYAIAEKTEYFIITSMNSVQKKIYDKNSSLGFIDLDDDDDSRVRRIINQNGQDVSFDQLKKDMVIEVILSNDIDVSVCIVRIGDSKKINGILGEIGSDIIVVDGVQYSTNTYFETFEPTIAAGEEYDFYIAADGTATYASRSNSDGSLYGFCLGFARGVGLDANATVKLLTSQNSVELYELSDKITLNGEKGLSKNDSDVDAALMNGVNYKYQLIRYKINDDNKMTMIDTANPVVNNDWEIDANANLDDKLTQYIDGASVNYRGGSYFGAPGFSFTKGVIFIVPTSLNSDSPALTYPDEAFSVTNISFLQNNNNYTVDIYDFNENYYPKAIVVYQDTTGATVDESSTSQLVYSVTDAVNPDGDATKLIRTYSRGLYHRYFVSTEKLEELVLPSPGDIVRFSLDYNNYITNVAVDVDFNSTTCSATVNYSGSWNGEMNFISGNAKTLGDKSLVLRADSYPEPLLNASNIAPLPMYTTYYSIFDVASGTVSKATEADVLTEDIVGSSQSSYVVCRLNYYAVTDVIIYKK